MFFKDLFLAFITFILIGQSVGRKGSRRKGGGIGKGPRAGTQTKDALCAMMLQWCEKVLAPFLIFYFFACLPHFNVSDHQTNLNINQR